MKIDKLFLFVLCLFFIIHKDALCINKSKDINTSTHTIDTLMQNIELDLRLNYGFLIQHHYETSAFNAHFPMFELSLQKQTYGGSEWHSYYNYPTIGLTAFYTDFGSVDIYGKAFALYPFINFPFNKSKENTIGLRFGVGLGYLTKKFDTYRNFNNTTIGSNFNAAINLSLEYKRLVSERFKMAFFISLTHFSNGCSHQPNAGINAASAGISGAYLFNEESHYIHPASNIKTSYKKIKPEFYIGMSYGMKRIYYMQNDNFSVYNLELYAMDRVSKLSKFGIGFDIVYDLTDKLETEELYQKYTELTFYEKLKPGISIAYELLISDVSFIFNFGYHLYGIEMSYGRWYQKIGMKINFGSHLYGKITLNTHFGVADYVGFGLGIKL